MTNRKPPDPHGRDEDCGDRRAHHPCHVDTGAVQRHRVTDQGRSHDLGYEGLPGRVVGRAQRAECQRQHDDTPDINVAAQHQHPEGQRDQPEPGLGDQQDPPLREPVYQQPGIR
jgi:hypothetical protein